MKHNLNVLRNQGECNYIVCCKSLCVPKKDLREGSTIALLLTKYLIFGYSFLSQFSKPLTDSTEHT